MDIICVGITLLFFLAALAYVAGCDRLDPFARDSVPRPEALMTIDHIVGLIVTLGLLVYLTYALLKPEKF